MADVQTGFGPFVAVYLTTHAWTQIDIGLVLTVGGLVALAGQMPGGALVDAVRSARLVAAVALVAMGASAVTLALWPIFPVVMASRILHSVASCVLGPALAAISLGLVGHAALGERIGRNARFMSLGGVLAAAGMGASGHMLSAQAVFFVTAALVIPTLIALATIRMPVVAAAKIASSAPLPGRRPASVRSLVLNRTLLIFAACIMLFHLANAATLPLLGGLMAARSSEWATVAVAACMIVPQLVVAACAPWVGRGAQQWGRRPLLVAGFAALAIRAVLLAFVSDPSLVIAIQLLDGVSAAVLGVMFPLVVADITRGTGRFNLGLGMVGSAMGIGASVSTVLAGYLIDHFGRGIAFFGLGGIALLGLALVWLAMPETRPEEEKGRAVVGARQAPLAAA